MGKSKEVGKELVHIRYISENGLSRLRGVIGDSGR